MHNQTGEFVGVPMAEYEALMDIITAARHVSNAGNDLIHKLATNDLKRALTTYDALIRASLPT